MLQTLLLMVLLESAKSLYQQLAKIQPKFAQIVSIPIKIPAVEISPLLFYKINETCRAFYTHFACTSQAHASSSLKQHINTSHTTRTPPHCVHKMISDINEYKIESAQTMSLPVNFHLTWPLLFMRPLHSMLFTIRILLKLHRHPLCHLQTQVIQDSLGSSQLDPN